MKIILIVTNEKGRNVIFVSDTLEIFKTEEAIRLVKERKLQNIYVVRGKNHTYLRSSRNVSKKEQLEYLAVSSQQLFATATGLHNAPSTPPALTHYLELYERSLQEKGGPFIIIEGHSRILTQPVKEELVLHAEYISDAAKKFTIDPYLLGAILIDEIAQFTPFEDIVEGVAVFFIGRNASAGIAQVKIETARGLIKNGYYNPNPNDPKLSLDNIKKTSRVHLYQYIKEPKHSIFFAAARVRALIDEWAQFLDVSKRPEILATLYSRTYKAPHAEPKANSRGLQIASEFYKLATVWLK